jgi:hypothetical protein
MHANGMHLMAYGVHVDDQRSERLDAGGQVFAWHLHHACCLRRAVLEELSHVCCDIPDGVVAPLGWSLDLHV